MQEIKRQEIKLNLKKFQDVCDALGGPTILARAAGFCPSTVTRIYNGETRPTLANLSRLASAAQVDGFWLLDGCPWARLPSDRPDLYDDLISEYSNSQEILGFGRNLHCQLHSAQGMMAIFQRELENRGVSPDVRALRRAENQRLVDKAVSNNLNIYQYDRYVAVGVAHSMVESLQGCTGAVNEVLRNLDRFRNRAVFGFVTDEVFDEREAKVRGITGFPQFTSVTVAGRMGIVWCDGGIWYTHDPDIVRQLREEIATKGLSTALGVNNYEWGKWPAGTMSHVTDACKILIDKIASEKKLP